MAMVIYPETIQGKDKIQRGLEIAFQRLLEFKKQKDSPLIIVKDGKIIKVSAKEFIKNRPAYHPPRATL